MDKQELREYCERYMIPNTLEDCQTMLDKFARFFCIVIEKHQLDTASSQAEADLRIILQMLFSKTVHIKSLLNGIGYEFCNRIEYDDGGFSVERICMNPVIDPTILATQVRSVFESLCAFELLYIIPDSAEKKEILFRLFQIEGLRYQARHYEGKDDPEIVEIRDIEQNQIEENINYIKKTQTYKGLDQPNRAKLDEAMRGKDYRVKICDNSVSTKIHWWTIPNMFHLDHEIFDNIYTHFSTYAHPSYISVRNYRDMFTIDNPHFIDFAKLEVKFCLTFLSIFIGDYFKIFPKVKETYLTIPIEDQILLNFHNKLTRGNEYSFSDAWKILED